MEEEKGGVIKASGLGVVLTTLFIAGQMAGGGVLLLPGALVNTGAVGVAIIIYFTLNGAFVGTRLGLCWIMVEERYPEYRTEKCRDPYPTIAEKAAGKIARHFSTACIMGVQYGTGVGFLILTAKFMDNIFEYAGWLSGDMSPCRWMVVMAVVVTPLCWFGSPDDFWFVAPTALLATITACLMIMVNESMDVTSESSCFNRNPNYTDDSNIHPVNESHTVDFNPFFPSIDFLGFGEAFSFIMFAFAGSASFPTYQSDMKDSRDFPKAVMAAMTILLLIYVPMAATGYFELGDVALNDGGIVCVLCEGPIKVTVEVLLLIHLLSAYPMFLNPPNQFMENILGIPPTFNIKRTLFRSVVILILLFLAESLPSFSGILSLISSVFVTCLTFVFPPFFYLRLVNKSSENKAWEQREASILIKILCYQAIVVGVFGGVLSFISAVKYIGEGSYVPCYVQEMERSC